jgi:hypothetical protein
MFGIVNQVERRGKNGFTSAIITGRRRIGKTMYSLQCVYQLRIRQGDTPDMAWEVALNSCVFSMEELIRKIQSHTYKQRSEAIIWDDAGVYGGSLLYLYNVDNAMVLKALMDTIGTRTKLLLLTCPNVGGLMKFLRNYGDYIVDISIADRSTRGERNATVYQQYHAKNLVQRWRRAWIDEFNVRIDTKYYSRYTEERDKYANKIIKELLKRGKERRAEETDDNKLVRQDKLQPDVVEPDIQSDYS